MKNTGICRKIDELGRVVIPIEIRRSLDISEKDELEIHVNESSVILKKHEQTCVFCGSVRDVLKYKDKSICPKCLNALKALD